MQRAPNSVSEGASTPGSRLGPQGALAMTLSIGVVLFFFFGLAAAQVYSAVTDGNGVAGLDRPALDLALSLRTPWLDASLTGYTNIAGKVGMAIIAITALLGLSLWRRSWTPAILVVAAASGSLLMTVAGKLVFGRDRPPLIDAVPPYEHSASFPSGHTLNATAIIGIVTYLLVIEQTTRRAQALTVGVATVFVVTTGLTRVFLGHHWFTDVLFAWLLGFAWLVMIITVHRLVLTVHTRHGTRIAQRHDNTRGQAS